MTPLVIVNASPVAIRDRQEIIPFVDQILY